MTPNVSSIVSQGAFDRAKNYKIGLYIRVSTEEQAENPEGSIKSQEERLYSAVKYKNMEANFGEVTGVFIDRARSGKDTNRPELRRLLDAIRTREVNFVLVTELSRLSRSIKDFCDMWDLMKAYGCGFMSLRESFDTSTAAGEMVLFSLANIAQFERKQISERISANFLSRASRGLFNGGSVPIGYELDESYRGRLKIDEEGAKAVRAAFHAFLIEGSLLAATKWLNQNAVYLRKKSKGSPYRLGSFTVDNLHGILTQKMYTGVRPYRGKNGTQLEAQAAWPAIVSPDTFERVQLRLNQNKARFRNFSRVRYPYILSGKLICLTCGTALCGKSAHGNGGKIAYYEHGWTTKRMSCMVKDVFHCNPHRVLAKVMEPQIWDELWKVIVTPELAQDLVKEAQKLHGLKSSTARLDEVRRRVQTLERQLESVAARIAELPSDVPAAPLYKQMQKIEAAKADAQQELAGLQATAKAAEMPMELQSYEELLKYLRRLGDQLGKTPHPEQVETREVCRKILYALVHKI